jgi:uncharacterized membrane protein
MVRAGQTISQLALHMSVAFGVMYAMTGSVAFGGVAALIEPICNVALLPLHDRVWEKIRQRARRRERVVKRQALAAIPS